MTDERCTCCDLPAYSCGKALERKRIAEQQERRRVLLEDMRFSVARFPGRCQQCNEWTIEEGDPIVNVEGLGWVGGMCCAGA